MTSSSYQVGTGVRGDPTRFQYAMEYLADAFFVVHVQK
jgi:hypothetical protein